MNSLNLFNSVIEKEPTATKPFVSKEGYVIMPNALWAKDSIIEFYWNEKLNGNDLNKTFHKSWAKIENSSRFELFLHQIVHYISTYGSSFEDEIYIPDEVLNIPKLELKFKIIRGISKEELINKCLDLLKSGVALKQETIALLLETLIRDCNYSFTGNENIKNKEAKIILADKYNVLPTDPVDLLRFVIYKSTNNTLLIKNQQTYSLIESSKYNPQIVFNEFGLEKLGSIFNRFKPLFISYKSKCPSTINKISRLSKKHHIPLVENPLNYVSSKTLYVKDLKWLDNATIYSLFKALSITYQKGYSNQDTFIYRVRNGKSFTETKEITQSQINVNIKNHKFILSYLKDRIDIEGKNIYLPKDIEYALPTSEKLFVGNIPTGTKFSGENMVVGVYWKNEWGAYDLDLSGMNLNGKVGWNSDYKQKGSLYFSGDITSAPNGAVEYLYAKNGLSDPTIIYNNIYHGEHNAKFKILVGYGDNIDMDYMMNPNNLIIDQTVESVQKQSILGILIPNRVYQTFVLLNFGASNFSVSGYGKHSFAQIKALYQQWSNPLTLNYLLEELDVNIVKDKKDSDVDLSINSLEKDTFINLFK